MMPLVTERRTLWPLGLVLVLLALSPWIVRGALGALASNSNQTIDWLPSHFAETNKYFDFLTQFGTDEILVASWDGCTLDDPRLDALAEAVRGLRDEATSEPMFPQVWTGRSVLAELMGEPLELPRNVAIDRMQGWLVGDDRQATAAVMVIARKMTQKRKIAVSAVEQVATEQLGLKPGQLHLGGPTVDSVAIDQESQQSLHILTAFSVLVGLLLSWRFLGSLRLMMLVFITAGSAELASLAMVYYLGVQMDSVLIMMPALVYILTVSGCVHQLNYYLDELRERGLAGAPLRALQHSWQPSLLATATTAMGLLSLWIVGDVVPVRKFGLMAALGVMLSLVFLFGLLPCLLTLWKASPQRMPKPGQAPRRGQRSLPMLAVTSAVRYYKVILWLCVLLLPLLGWGVSRIQTSVKIQDLFSNQSRVITDYRWLEQRIGPLIPIEIVIRFPSDDKRPLLQRMRIVEEVRQAIAEIDGVGGTISAATFAPVLPDDAGARAVITRRVVERKLTSHLDVLESTGYLVDQAKPRELNAFRNPNAPLNWNPGDQLWRISARVEAFNKIDYGKFLDTLKARITPVLTAHISAAANDETEHGQGHGDPLVADGSVARADDSVASNNALAASGAGSASGEVLDVMVCGGVPTVSVVQRQMLDDLASSFTTAFLMIGLLLALVLRSIGAALVMMLPNVLPVLLVFGMMGWLEVPVDLGSMMTISTALGISVDNELHFFSWFRRALARGLRRNAAVLAAYRHCGAAMAQTGIICGLGMLAFGLSPFVPIARFGWLMFLLLLTAMVGDLVLLPALLTGPMGRFFGTHKPRPATATARETLEPQSVTAGSL